METTNELRISELELRISESEKEKEMYLRWYKDELKKVEKLKLIINAIKSIIDAFNEKV